MRPLLRWGTALFIFSLTAGTTLEDARAARYAAIVIDANNGETLYARNINKKRYPASLAKMMTLYLTFEALRSGVFTLDTEMPVSRRASGQAPSRLGLKIGQRLSVNEAILALITKSANDAATVLAEAIAGSEIQFAIRMTDKAKILGMKNTQFRNASGLPNRRQRSTARDLALLARALITDFPDYYPYFATKSFSFNKKVYRNHNNLLGDYPGADGIKTGYTRASGFNLAASVFRGEHRLIGIVLGGKTVSSRDRHMEKILNIGFEQIAKRSMSHLNHALEHEVKLRIPIRKPTQPRNKIPQPPVPKGLMTKELIYSTWPTDVSWEIQIGAFEHYNSAQKQIHIASLAQPEQLENKRIVIIPAQGDNGGLYRARLAGFKENEARIACSLLERKGIACIPIAPISSEENPWILQ